MAPSRHGPGMNFSRAIQCPSLRVLRRALSEGLLLSLLCLRLRHGLTPEPETTGTYGP